jgi:hypothetical protein
MKNVKLRIAQVERFGFFILFQLKLDPSISLPSSPKSISFLNFAPYGKDSDSGGKRPTERYYFPC